MKNFSILTLIIAIFFVGCTSGPAVNTETSPTAAFGEGEYNTYAYLPSGETDADNAVFNEAVIREVDQEMQARGYRLDPQDPDLLVLVRSMYERETAVERAPIYTAYDYYGTGFYAPSPLGPQYYPRYNTIPRVTGTAIREVPYTEGTFVVDVIDASNNEIVWRGWSSTPVDPMALESSVRQYVDNIFEEFPVEPQ